MKALIALLLALLLTACSAAPAAPPAAPPAALQEVPEVPLKAESLLEAGSPPQQEETEETIRYEAEIVLHSDTALAEDGTPLFTYDIRVPELKAYREDGTQITEAKTPAEEQAMTVVAAFHERFAVWYAEESFLELKEATTSDLAWHRQEGFDWYGGYHLDLSCEVYQTQALVSISGIYCAYTGGAHPNTYLLGWNFDLDSGTFLDAGALAGQEDLHTAVSEEILRQARERFADEEFPLEELYWPEYESIIADWPSYAVFFDESGMTVAFSPYELAAYAAGAQIFHIPYEWLSVYLDEHSLELLGLAAE